MGWCKRKHCWSAAIGNDVVIEPNTYVNFDVLDYMVVIGNTVKIIHKENALDGYIDFGV